MSRFLTRPSLGLALAAAVGWLILITALHLVVNAPRRIAAGPLRTVQVGGLPVT
jgi:hypothetical protein